MTYNLSKYVSNNSSIVPVTNGENPESTGDRVVLNGSGGDDRSRGLKVDNTVQFVSKANDSVTSKELIEEVHSLLKNRFDIVLPEITVKGTTYPAVIASSILPLQIPGYLGTDNNGLHMWSVNYQITTKEE